MGTINRILDIPLIWDLSQLIFGCNSQKMKLYRSVFKGRGRLLDFGCADGNVFSAFKDFDYYGIDKNTRLITHARRKYASYKNAHFIEADILDRPFTPDFFDFVLFACTGHHLQEENLLKIMRALSEALKTDGRLYFFDTIRNPKTDGRLLKLLIKLDQGQFMRDEKAYRTLVYNFSERLEPLEIKILEICGSFMPQPTYFYTEFKKR